MQPRTFVVPTTTTTIKMEKEKRRRPNSGYFGRRSGPGRYLVRRVDVLPIEATLAAWQQAANPDVPPCPVHSHPQGRGGARSWPAPDSVPPISAGKRTQGNPLPSPYAPRHPAPSRLTGLPARRELVSGRQRR